jgi:hypothetical protein
MIQIDTNIYQKGGGDVNTKITSEMMSDKTLLDLKKNATINIPRAKCRKLLDTLQIMSYVDLSIADFERQALSESPQPLQTSPQGL